MKFEVQDAESGREASRTAKGLLGDLSDSDSARWDPCKASVTLPADFPVVQKVSVVIGDISFEFVKYV